MNAMECSENDRRLCRQDFLISGLLVALVVSVYAPAFRYGFVNFDDYGYVKENRFVAEGFTPRSVWYAWTTFDLGNWMPLTWLSLELDATLFGIEPKAFHATNILFHAANAVLFFIVLRLLTAFRGYSAAAAALFAVHPLHVESVAWISERKDVLSTFWLLVTLLAYQRYAVRPERGRYLMILAAFTAGLLAKSMLVTLPLLLLLLDFWPLRRIAWSSQATTNSASNWMKLVIEKIPLLCLSLAVGVVTIVAQQSSASVSSLETLPLSTRLLNAIHAYGWYLMKTVWPTDLCVHYLHPGTSLSGIQVAGSAIVLLVITIVVARKAATHPHLLVGWLWFLISLLPVIGLLQVGHQAYADRYTYVPHLGLFVGLVWEINNWIKRSTASARVASGLAVVVILAASLLARAQVTVWQDSGTLLSRVLELNSENPYGHLGMAKWRHEEGKLDESARHFQKVLSLQPTNVEAISRLGWIYHQQQNWKDATTHYEWALRIDPLNELALSKLSELTKQGAQPGSKTPQKATIPDQALQIIRLGFTYAQQGKMQDALKRFEEAIEIAPEFADPHNNAALALKHLGRTDEAIKHLRQAIALDANNANSHINLAALLEAKGEYQAASEHFAAALRIEPNDPELRQHLKWLQDKLQKK